MAKDDGLKVVENRFSVERLSPRYTKAVDESHLACARSVLSKRRAVSSVLLRQGYGGQALEARHFVVTAPVGSAARQRTRKAAQAARKNTKSKVVIISCSFVTISCRDGAERPERVMAARSTKAERSVALAKEDALALGRARRHQIAARDFSAADRFRVSARTRQKAGDRGREVIEMMRSEYFENLFIDRSVADFRGFGGEKRPGALKRDGESEERV